MKIRTALVSNSSSSSFVVAVDADRVEEYLREVLGVLEIKSKEGLDKHFLERYYYEGETLDEIFEARKHKRKEYEEYLKQIESGKSVLFITVSWDAEEVFDELCTDRDWAKNIGGE